MKLDYSAIWESAMAHKKLWVIVALAAILIISAMYMTDCGSNWSFNRGVNKQKQVIANNLDQIRAANAQIANLEQQKAAAQANINAAVQDYQKATYGLDNAKTETNQALANLNSAIKSNSNIDRSADDVLKALEKLNQ